MTLNGVMAVILCYLTEFGGFEGQLRHCCEVQTHTVCGKNVVLSNSQGVLKKSAINVPALESDNSRKYVSNS